MEAVVPLTHPTMKKFCIIAALSPLCFSALLGKERAPMFLDLPSEDAILQNKNTPVKTGVYMTKLTKWPIGTSEVSWKMQLPYTGKLSVILSQASLTGGSDYEVLFNGQVIKGKTQATGGLNSYKSFEVGQLNVGRSGVHTLTLRATQLDANNPFHFDKIRLIGVPAADGTRTAYSLPALDRGTPTRVTQRFASPAHREIPHNQLSRQEVKQGWRLLFDGKTLTGWTGYRQAAAPTRWRAVNGELHCKPDAGKTGGTLMTEASYRDFEFSCDWKVSSRGDSGIFFRFNESKHQPYEQFPEYQIIDNVGHPMAKNPINASGACYGLYPTALKAMRGAKKWNTTRVRLVGSNVTFYLNGVKTAAFDTASAEFKNKVRTSKFHRWGDFAKLEKGHIGLQDYGNEISFRNIKIRPIRSTEGEK